MTKRIILKELKEILFHTFGDNIKDLILFGSQAIGKAHKNSDFDLLIILNKDYDWRYKHRIIETIYSIDLKYDVYVDVKIISVNELLNSIKGLNPMYDIAISSGVHL